MIEQEVLDRAAQRLRSAATDREPCAPVRDLIGATDVVAAYQVQQMLTEARLAAGGKIVGRKIGLTSLAVQAQLGVDQPDFGVLFDDMSVASGGIVPINRLLQPKIEAEIAFVLSSDLAVGALDVDQVRDAVDYAVAALEIVDSRIAGWDITFGDTVADNASSGLYVLGETTASLDTFSPVDAEMSLTLDGEVASTGTGAACLGDPLSALQWLAVTARDLGQPLHAGQVVLSGALGPMVTVTAGHVVTATISGLGTVSVNFGPADATTTTDTSGREAT